MRSTLSKTGIILFAAVDADVQKIASLDDLLLETQNEFRFATQCHTQHVSKAISLLFAWARSLACRQSMWKVARIRLKNIALQ